MTERPIEKSGDSIHGEQTQLLRDAMPYFLVRTEHILRVEDEASLEENFLSCDIVTNDPKVHAAHQLLSMNPQLREKYIHELFQRTQMFVYRKIHIPKLFDRQHYNKLSESGLIVYNPLFNGLENRYAGASEDPVVARELAQDIYLIVQALRLDQEQKLYSLRDYLSLEHSNTENFLYYLLKNFTQDTGFILGTIRQIYRYKHMDDSPRY